MSDDKISQPYVRTAKITRRQVCHDVSITYCEDAVRNASSCRLVIGGTGKKLEDFCQKSCNMCSEQNATATAAIEKSLDINITNTSSESEPNTKHQISEPNTTKTLSESELNTVHHILEQNLTHDMGLNATNSKYTERFFTDEFQVNNFMREADLKDPDTQIYTSLFNILVIFCLVATVLAMAVLYYAHRWQGVKKIQKKFTIDVFDSELRQDMSSLDDDDASEVLFYSRDKIDENTIEREKAKNYPKDKGSNHYFQYRNKNRQSNIGFRKVNDSFGDESKHDDQKMTNIYTITKLLEATIEGNLDSKTQETLSSLGEC
mmetsp:Transcript_24894/g.38552  ORF Transcript_24894/g.38552 Transcript_24894/m.38552 type:complete len:319 (+) Transcript_24894:38-994(+)